MQVKNNNNTFVKTERAIIPVLTERYCQSVRTETNKYKNKIKQTQAKKNATFPILFIKINDQLTTKVIQKNNLENKPFI